MSTTLTEVLKDAKSTQQEWNKAFMATFFSAFAGEVLAVADEHNLSKAVRELIADMVTSIMNGNGSTPDGISDDVAKLIRSAFANTCVQHKVRAGSMIRGTNTKWFPSFLEDAQKRAFAQKAGHANPKAA